MTSRNSQTVYGLIAFVWVALVARAYMNSKDAEDFVITVTQEEVQAFARIQLSAIQERSFAENIELCGIIFERSDGTLGASDPRTGDEASCGIRYFDEPGMRPVASFHTHAAYSQEYDSEVPSVIDLENDFSSGMDGYVATPGGRFWWVDHRRPTARQICGAGCLEQDPKYVPCPAAEPDLEYNLPDLMARQSTKAGSC